MLGPEYIKGPAEMEFIELIKSPKVDRVSLYDHLNACVEGTLCITGHLLLLSARQENSQELWLLHRNIDFVEKRPCIVNNVIVGGVLTLKCKDLRIISLEIKNVIDYSNVAATLDALYDLQNTELDYPFFYRPMFTILEDGYTMFQTELEFSKIISGITNCITGSTCTVDLQEAERSCCEWRISNVNKHFETCETYSVALIVPKSITDEQIIQSAAFRDGGRFPVLSYRHQNGATMLRSSQPVISQAMKRCRADEAILNVVLGRCKKGFIVDTWSKGKSNTETDQYYSQWKKVNRSIGNISTPTSILDSFAKLIDACNDITCSQDKWLSKLDGSGWLNLVLKSLNVACVIAQCLDQEGSPVLVHGSKGMDSTLIVTSLVQIILNPDCRTVRGFQALIEREWIQAGYPFASRHRFSCYTPAHMRNKSAGSTFILFLDCIFQVYAQFPCSFEFSTQLLVLIFEHSYFSPYGTFLYDSDRERHKYKVHTRTTSLWSYLNRPDVLKNLLNPLYEPNHSVIWPSVAPISLDCWCELYMRWKIDQQYSFKTSREAQNVINQYKDLRLKVVNLRKIVLDLSHELKNMWKAYV